ncbi:transcriptional regulator [Actinorhabdospora filicis]|uniref:Transcriptional regulator n=1 Tax=Actinorhabdospora filicis TaxID=1785913 RepID=A0A9W6SSD1_9ACTN|nr:transcriptional regulator [Actinorhabdospora filicis]
MTEGLSAGEAARRLGVAVTTLRTWHRRYGLGPGGHAAGRHRRYREADLARLELMCRLTSRGVPAAEAARRVSAVPPAALGHGAPTTLAPPPGTLVLPMSGAPPAPPPVSPIAAVRGLIAAAFRLDVTAVRETLARHLAVHGVPATWDGLLRPALTGVGDRHAATGRHVEVEHLLSRCAGEALAAVPRPTAPPAPVLLACADDEQHSLPLEALAAALAERGLSVRMLGARVPPEALAAAVARTGPALVIVWSHAAATGDPAQLARLQASGVLVAAAGPGWPAPPPGVLTPASLEEAMTLVLRAADV